MKASVLICLFILPITIKAQDSVILNTIGIKFRKVLPGSFYLGAFSPTASAVGFFSQQDEPQNDSILQVAKLLSKQASKPGFEVKVKHAFYIGVYEISQLEWQKIMKTNPSKFDQAYLGKNTDDHPVETVSWRDCKKFIARLNKRERGKFKYRLPSEIEWEYAARGGKKEDISWQEIWNTAVIGKQEPTIQGSKNANAYGLFDMLGNVWEWVEDRYNEKIFADQYPSKFTNEHVIKGACFYGDVKNATYMTHAGAKGKRYDIGFRLILEKVN